LRDHWRYSAIVGDFGVEMHCSKCGIENPVGKKFCGKCGARLAARCPKCGGENPPENTFCGECGTPLETAAVTTDRQSAPPPIRIADTPTPEHLEGERKTVTALFAVI
jgi:ribosomal protein L40E